MSKESPRRSGLPQALGLLTRARTDRRPAVPAVVPPDGRGGALSPRSLHTAPCALGRRSHRSELGCTDMELAALPPDGWARRPSPPAEIGGLSTDGR